jgi:hypothetical protein
MQQICKQSLTILSLLSLFLSACGSDERPLPDVSGIEAPLQVQRFEQDLFQLDTNNFAPALAELAVKYPVFAELFSVNLLEAGSLSQLSPEQLEYFRGYVCSPVYRAVYDTTQLVFPDLSKIKDDLQQALRYFRFHFPEAAAPERLTTFTSAFNYSSIIYGDNELGVGLDMFLGSANFDYQRYSPGATIFSNYLTRTYNKDHLVASLMRVVLDDLMGPAPGDRLLDEMIHRGKQLYLLDQLLPTTQDTVKFRVSKEQWNWLQENERDLWSHLLSEDLLYSTRYQDYRKLIEPSPSGAPALPEASPGEAANYLGFRIVQQFLQQSPNLRVGDLLYYKDAQEILEKSRYKPPRK